MATMEVREVVFFGQTYRLPFGTVDTADKGYISDVRNALKQLDAGLLTEYEMLEQLLLSHAQWCSI